MKYCEGNANIFVVREGSMFKQRNIGGENTVCSRGCNYVFNSKPDQERHDLIVHQAERKADRKRETRKRGKNTDSDAMQVIYMWLSAV